MEALNGELKYERDFSEPMRILDNEDGYLCPRCNKDFNDVAYHVASFKYCPFCGIKILPPEEPEEIEE